MLRYGSACSVGRKHTQQTTHCALESKCQGKFFLLLPQVLHYGPMDNSKTGKEEVFSFIHNLPDETWPEPDPSDPLSVVDQVSCLTLEKIGQNCFFQLKKFDELKACKFETRRRSQNFGSDGACPRVWLPRIG